MLKENKGIAGNRDMCQDRKHAASNRNSCSETGKVGSEHIQREPESYRPETPMHRGEISQDRDAYRDAHREMREWEVEVSVTHAAHLSPS